MSKHLLRKLLDLQSDKSDKTSDNLSNKEKYVQYYSTDKGRNVITRVPTKMSIIRDKEPSEQSTITSHYSTYADDLSDVSSTLLRKVLKTDKKLKPLTYYSTDKDSYVKSLGSSKLNIIKDITELSSNQNSNEYSDNYSDKYSDNYSDKYSDNLSSISSYNNSDTSYDSFYDNNDKQHFSKLIEKYDLKDILDLDKSSDSTFNIFKQSHRKNTLNDV
jgi:hypothetical protein